MKTEILKALIEGRDVQYTYSDGDVSWIDFYPSNVDADYSVYASLFNGTLGCRWRIKPSTTIMLYAKTALMLNENGYYTQQVHNEHEERELETQCIYFRKWLTGWINYLF